MAEHRSVAAEAERLRCSDGSIELGPEDEARLIKTIDDLHAELFGLRALIEARGQLSQTLARASSLRARISQLMADVVEVHVPRCLSRTGKQMMAR